MPKKAIILLFSFLSFLFPHSVSAESADAELKLEKEKTIEQKTLYDIKENKKQKNEEESDFLLLDYCSPKSKNNRQINFSLNLIAPENIPEKKLKLDKDVKVKIIPLHNGLFDADGKSEYEFELQLTKKQLPFTIDKENYVELELETNFGRLSHFGKVRFTNNNRCFRYKVPEFVDFNERVNIKSYIGKNLSEWSGGFKIGLPKNRINFVADLMPVGSNSTDNQFFAKKRIALNGSFAWRDIGFRVNYDSQNRVFPQFFIRSDRLFPVTSDTSYKHIFGRNSLLSIRVNQEQNWLELGDIEIGKNQEFEQRTDSTELIGHYHRITQGVRGFYETADQKLKTTFWFSYNNTHHFVEDQPILGITGPYGVQQPDLIPGSEIIYILTRARNLPSLILKSKRMRRFTDYDYEPISGRFVFFEPLSTFDEDHNPQTLRISYDTENKGRNAQEQEKKWSFGTRVIKDLGDKQFLSFKYRMEQNNRNSQFLHFSYRFTPNTNQLFLVELGYTQQQAQQGFYIPNNPVNTVGFNLNPNKNYGIAYRIQYVGSGEKWNSNISLAHTSADFANPQHLSVPNNRHEFLTLFRYQFNKEWDLGTENNYSKNVGIGRVRKLSQVALNQRSTFLEKSLRQELAIRYITNDGGAVESPAFNGLNALVGTGYGIWNGVRPSWNLNNYAPTNNTNAPMVKTLTTRYRVRYQLSDKLMSIFDYEFPFKTNDTYQNRKVLSYGLQYQFTDQVLAYIRRENSDVENQPIANHAWTVGLTQFGNNLQQIYSELRMNNLSRTRDELLALGSKNPLKFTQHWRGDIAVESLQRVRSNGIRSALAVSLGQLYTGFQDLKVGGRVEFRQTKIERYHGVNVWAEHKIDENQSQSFKLWKFSGIEDAWRLQYGYALRVNFQQNHFFRYEMGNLRHGASNNNIIKNLEQPVRLLAWQMNTLLNNEELYKTKFKSHNKLYYSHQLYWRYAPTYGFSGNNFKPTNLLYEPKLSYAWQFRFNSANASNDTLKDKNETTEKQGFENQGFWQTFQTKQHRLQNSIYCQIHQKVACAIEQSYGFTKDLWLHLGYIKGHYIDDVWRFIPRQGFYLRLNTAFY